MPVNAVPERSTEFTVSDNVVVGGKDVTVNCVEAEFDDASLAVTV